MTKNRETISPPHRRARPGIILGGRCVMAPSSLDLAKPGDQHFVQMARNGLIVLLDGEQLPLVTAFDEQAGIMTAAGGEWRGRVTVSPGA